MNYKGKLYGRIGNNTYFDTAYTTDDWDAMETKIKEIEKVKRKPLSDGTLPMTDEEKKEFKKLVNIAEDEFFERADLVKDYIQIWWTTKHCSWRLRSIKAILWLAERFDLSSNN